MTALVLITVAALTEYLVFSAQVGLARKKYGVSAPAVSGNEHFERYFRVQQNTMEQLVIFLPAMYSFAWSAEAIGWPGYQLAALLGLVWIFGRFIYARAYVSDPKKRGAGFMLTFLPSALMIAGTVLSVLLAWI